MKPPVLISVFAAALVASALATPSVNRNAEDQLVLFASRAYIAHGMSPSAVEFAFGAPDAKLAQNVWVYWNVTVANFADRQGYDTLVVAFTANRVSLIRLAPGAPVRAFVARQAKADATVAAAK